MDRVCFGKAQKDLTSLQCVGSITLTLTFALIRCLTLSQIYQTDGGPACLGHHYITLKIKISAL